MPCYARQVHKILMHQHWQRLYNMPRVVQRNSHIKNEHATKECKGPWQVLSRTKCHADCSCTVTIRQSCFMNIGSKLIHRSLQKQNAIVHCLRDQFIRVYLKPTILTQAYAKLSYMQRLHSPWPGIMPKHASSCTAISSTLSL